MTTQNFGLKFCIEFLRKRERESRGDEPPAKQAKIAEPQTEEQKKETREKLKKFPKQSRRSVNFDSPRKYHLCFNIGTK